MSKREAIRAALDAFHITKQRCVHVRPDFGEGHTWAVDVYTATGEWVTTTHRIASKQEAQKHANELRKANKRKGT